VVNVANSTVHTCKTCGDRLFRRPGPGRWPVFCDSHKRDSVHRPLVVNEFTNQLIEDHRRRGCIVCGLVEPLFLLHLHHVDPRAKEANIALIRLWRPERAMVELAKTVPTCANHHAILHHELRRDGAGMTLPQLVDHIRSRYPQTLRRIASRVDA